DAVHVALRRFARFRRDLRVRPWNTRCTPVEAWLDDRSEPLEHRRESWRESKSLETHARGAESIPSSRDLDTRIDARQPSIVHGLQGARPNAPADGVFEG